MAEHTTGRQLTAEQVRRDGLRLFPRRRAFMVLFALFGILSLAGVLAFAQRMSGGLADRAAWGYYAAIFSFLLLVTTSAPVVAIGLRMAHADWRRSVTRVAELFTVAGPLLVLMFIPLLLMMPPAEGRVTIWMGWPHAPGLYDTIALAALMVTGLLMLHGSVLPDFVAERDAHPSGLRKHWLALKTWRWSGGRGGWRLQKSALGILGGLYLALWVLVNVLFSADFALALVPGWKDPLFPFQQVQAGIQSGLALTVVMAAVLRRHGYADYIGLDHFWAMGKILLALSLLWAYFWFSGFIVMWYGRMPVEQNLFELFWFGPYAPLFIATFVLNFAGPLLILMWNPLRRSIRWPVVVSVMILIGTFLQSIRFYVASFSVTETGKALEHVPPAHLPDFADVGIMAGGLAAVALLYLLTTRVAPILPIWEVKDGLLLRSTQTMVKLGVKVVAKPD